VSSKKHTHTRARMCMYQQYASLSTSYVSAMASSVTRHTRTMRDRAAAITERNPLLLLLRKLI